MRKLVSGITTLVVLLVSSGVIIAAVAAAERTRPIQIGVLTDSWGPTPSVAGLRQGLLELGYRDNKDFVIGVRFTQGDAAALPAAARDLLQFGADLLFVSQESAAKAAQTMTSRIPIVFYAVGDPLRLGLVESFARPGGNITGVTDLHLTLSPKRLERFREMIPDLKRVLYPYHATNAAAVAEARAFRDAANRLGIVLVEKPVRTQEEAQATLAAIQQDEVDGILVPRALHLNIPGLILKVTGRLSIPTMSADTFWVEQGALASYGVNLYESGRQAARLVDKIIKGANPAEIPVEVNPKIEFAINLKTAKALELTIAPEVLFRADRIIR